MVDGNIYRIIVDSASVGRRTNQATYSVTRSTYSGPASRKVSIESTGVSRRSSRTTNGSVSRKPSESASSSSNPFVQAGGSGGDKRQSSVVDMKGESCVNVEIVIRRFHL